MTKQECLSKISEMLWSPRLELRVKKIDAVVSLVNENKGSIKDNVIAIITYDRGVVLTPIDGEPQLMAKRSDLYDAILAL